MSEADSSPGVIKPTETNDPSKWPVSSTSSVSSTSWVGSVGSTHSLKTYLITGGSGTLGTALTLHLLSQGHKVRAFARNEHRLAELNEKCSDAQKANLSCLPGSVEDLGRLKRALDGVDYVIHAAAMKRIDSCEYSPNEAINNNVRGTLNVAEACLDAGIKRAILVSTDKARSPSTLYGATKLCAERSWIASNRYRGSMGGVFGAVAYGNVWGSRGSVLHAFLGQVRHGYLSLTDPRCTRFHIKLNEAVHFVLRALEEADPGTLWVPRLAHYSLQDLASAFAKVYQLKRPFEVIGRRPGEKVHEDLIAENESQSVKLEDDWHFVVEPGKVHQRGGWRFCSDSERSPEVSVSQLEKEIRTWANL